MWVIENMNTGQIYTFYDDLKQCDKAVEILWSLHCIPDILNTAFATPNKHKNLFFSFDDRYSNFPAFFCIWIWFKKILSDT
jgi:hypothetical protein